MKSSDKRVQITSHLKFCSPTLLERQHTDMCVYLKRPQKLKLHDILAFDSSVMEEESPIPVLTSCAKSKKP